MIFFILFFKIFQDQFISNFGYKYEYDNNQRFIECDKDDNSNQDGYEDNQDSFINLLRDKNA